jgi:hypothetical protein
MAMRTGNLLLNASVIGALSVPFCAVAATPSDPISTFGISGSYNEYELESDIDLIDGQDESLPKGGLFYTFGNKMTGESGLIYQAGVAAKYGEKDESELLEGQFDVDVGLRAALQADNYVDFIVGAGYMWSRFEPDGSSDVELTSKSPFAKAALGYNHKFSSTTMRLEAGARYTIDGETKLDVEDVGSDKVDMEDRAHPYAELSFLWNQGYRGLPVMASVYYTQTRYELDESYDVPGATELKNDEVGFKVGLAF